MMKRGHHSTMLILLLVLVAAIAPRWARADDISEQKGFRLYATATCGPIGELFSSGAISINHRRVQGQQAIWDGDVIETLADTKASVLLDAVGQLRLANGATVRLATKPAGLDEKNTGRVLVASLDKGDMAVKLKQEASAHIEAGGATYTTGRGASLRIEVREGAAVIHEASDSIAVTPQRKKIIVTERVPKPNTLLGQVNLSTKERRELKLLLEKISRPSTTRLISYTPGSAPVDAEAIQSPQIVERLVNRLVRFEVDPPNLGNIVNAAGQVINAERTDFDGVVTVYFRAGDREGRGRILAFVDPTPDEQADTDPGTYTWNVTIKLPWYKKTRYQLIGGGGAAAILIACCLIPKERGPLQQIPPPIFKP